MICCSLHSVCLHRARTFGAEGDADACRPHRGLCATDEAVGLPV